MVAEHTILVVLKNGRRLKLKYDSFCGDVNVIIDEKLQEEFFSMGGHSIRTDDIRRVKVIKSQRGNYTKRY